MCLKNQHCNKVFFLMKRNFIKKADNAQPNTLLNFDKI